MARVYTRSLHMGRLHWDQVRVALMKILRWSEPFQRAVGTYRVVSVLPLKQALVKGGGLHVPRYSP